VTCGARAAKTKNKSAVSRHKAGIRGVSPMGVAPLFYYFPGKLMAHVHDHPRRERAGPRG
jgi:hypothetical protein